MIEMARCNAEEYGLSERVKYIQGNAGKMPFEDNLFDAVFTNDSLHEWSKPKDIFNEIWRVLKCGGKIFISDLRRDMFFWVKWFLWIVTKPKEIRPGLITSINAAYTPDELRELIRETALTSCKVKSNLMGFTLIGTK